MFCVHIHIYGRIYISISRSIPTAWTPGQWSAPLLVTALAVLGSVSHSDALNLGFAMTIKYRPCIAHKSTSAMTPDTDLFDWTVGKLFRIICGASSILKLVFINTEMIYCFLSSK